MKIGDVVNLKDGGERIRIDGFEICAVVDGKIQIAIRSQGRSELFPIDSCAPLPPLTAPKPTFR